MELEDLKRLESFSENDYERVSLAFLTAYSIYWLEEWMLPTTIESISVVNAKLFPLHFSMVGFREYPDALRTNRSLLQLGPKYRNLITGAAKKGFFLNQRGSEVAHGLIAKMGTPRLMNGVHMEEPKTPIGGSHGDKHARTLQPEELIRQVRDSILFNLFLNNELENAPKVHLLGLLRLYDNAPAKEKKTRIRAIKLAAEQLNDSEVLAFIAQVGSKFEAYINSN